MYGRRHRSGLDLWLIVVQLESPDPRGNNRFSFGDLEGKKSSKDCENNLGEDTSVKGKDAEHEINELPDRPSLDRSGRVGGIAGSGPGFGSCLARPQLFLDGWTWGRLTRSQGGFGRLRSLVVNMVNVIGQFVIVLWDMEWPSLGFGSIQGRGRRRGEQTVTGRGCEFAVFGKKGEADVTLGLEEIVNW